MSDPIPTMKVKVRDNQTEKARWGYGRGGPIIRTVVIPAVCPDCGGPRGEVRGMNGCDDGDYFHVNVWDNPCGYVDSYTSVLIEAGYHPHPDPQAPRTVQFEADGIIRAYMIPQAEWRPGITEAECDQITAAEVWALPTNRTDVGSAGQPG